MGKIDWYCSYCDLAFRAYDGRCPECNKPIRPINRFELNKSEQLNFYDLINNNDE
jgi:uncharacterized protein with PIN domain